MQYFGLKHLLKKIKKEIQLSRLNSVWRSKNTHNKTSLGEICDCTCIHVGNGTYGILNVYTFDHKNNNNVMLKIGHYCSIARDVVFLLAGEHNIKSISTFPFRAKYLDGMPESDSKGPILVEDDVWIGHGAVILSGVRIGQGAVIAAGAVVNKDVPPYAIVGGVPSKVIKYRFSESIIEKLINIDYSKITLQFIKKHAELLQKDIQSEDIELLEVLIKEGLYNKNE